MDATFEMITDYLACGYFLLDAGDKFDKLICLKFRADDDKLITSHTDKKRIFQRGKFFFNTGAKKL